MSLMHVRHLHVSYTNLELTAPGTQGRQRRAALATGNTYNVSMTSLERQHNILKTNVHFIRTLVFHRVIL